MPRNGSGIYSLPQAPFTAGSVISSAAVNSDLSDIASALTGSLPRDGQAGMAGQLKSSDGSTVAPGYSFTNETNTGFIRPSAGQLGVVITGTQVAYIDSTGWVGPVKGSVPVGTIMDYGGSAAPSLWLLCFGQNVSRASYPALFTALGTTFGSGDGTTFGIPDMRGRTAYGKDNMGGSAASRLTTTIFGADPTVIGNGGGAQTSSLVLANLPPIIPTGTISNGTITVSGFGSLRNVAGDFNNNGGGGGAFGAMSSSAPTLSASISTSTFTGTGGGGSSTAFATVSNGLILNKIIYAGA